MSFCGIESIAEAVRPAAIVAEGRVFSPHEIMAAMASITVLQQINIQTRVVHAAAFWTPAHGLAALREDVGRHNALDKLAGALAQESICASEGIVLLTYIPMMAMSLTVPLTPAIFAASVAFPVARSML
jgi:FdhD protein